MNGEVLTDSDWHIRALQAKAVVEAQMEEIRCWEHLVERLNEALPKEMVMPMVVLTAKNLDKARLETAELIEDMQGE